MSEWAVRRLSGEKTIVVLNDLADVYVQAYANDPDAGHSIYTRDAFLERTTQQAKLPGFTLIAGYADSQLAGFSFGLPFAAGRWWHGVENEPPGELKDVDKFAVIELVVLPSFQGRGLASRLMGTLLEDRPEQFATLLADKQGRARSMYDRWGWRTVQSLQPAPDVQELDVLVKALRA
jgi:ribosomal protein S18 acetylase RimI-like enzyme